MALLAAFGCAREIVPDTNQDEKTDSEEIVVRLTAVRSSIAEEAIRSSIAEEDDSETKTAVGEDGKVLWEAGDKLKLVTDDGRTIITDALEAGGETATFTATVTTADVLKWAVYPSDIEAGISGESLTVKIPDTQDGTFGNSSIAAGEIQQEGSTITLKNVCSLLRFTVPDNLTKAAKVNFGGNGLPMNGTVKVDGTSLESNYINTTSVQGAGIRVGVNVQGPGTYYAAVLPNAFSGMTMQVFDSEGTVLSESITTSVVPAKRSVIKSLGTLRATPFYEKRFVTENGGGTKDGKSWENAWSFSTLQTRLKDTKLNNHMIFVTGGTINSTSSLLDLKDDTKFKMFGGYPASGLSGTDITCRNIISIETVFSAKVSETPRRLFNYHGSASETLMDGITLANTYQEATGNSFTGTCVIVGVSATAVFVNCTFRNNTKVGNAIIRGGDDTAGKVTVKLTLDRCTFKDNNVSGIALLHCKPGCTLNVKDCDFSSGNVVSGDGNPYRVSYQTGGVVNFSGNNVFASNQVSGPYKPNN